MLYGLALIALVILSIIILAMVALQPAAQDEPPTITYTAAGRVHTGNGLQKR